MCPAPQIRTRRTRTMAYVAGAVVSIAIILSVIISVVIQKGETAQVNADRLFIVSPTTVTLNEDGSGSFKVACLVQPSPNENRTSHRISMRLETPSGQLIKQYPETNLTTRREGKPQDLPVNIPSSSVLALREEKVQLVVDCPSLLETSLTFQIDVHKPKGFLFIQTNKPLYRRGETVTIRVLSTDERLVPKTTPYKLYLKGPGGSNPKEICAEPKQVEIFNCSHTLPSKAHYGEWVLSAITGTNSNLVSSPPSSASKTSFQVVKETRKPFDVDLDIPYKVITDSTKWLNFTVSARENFGGAILGLVYVDVSLLLGSTKIGPLYHISTELNRRGQRHVSVDISRYITGTNDRFQSRDLRCFKLEILAGVIDRLGRHHVVSDKGVQFAEDPYVIINNRKSEFYYGSILYVVDLSIEHLNGSMASDIPVVLRFKSDDSSMYGNQYKYYHLRTNHMGRFTQQLYKPKMWEVFIGPEQMQQNMSFTVASSSEPAIALSLDKATIANSKVNDEIEIGVSRTDSLLTHEYTYMYSTNGKVLGNGSTRSLRFRIRITEEMFPLLAVTVWMVADGRMMNDTTHIQIRNPCEVKLKELFGLPKRTLSPSQSIDVNYVGDYNKIAIKAVDMATYLDKGMLQTDTSQIMDAVEKRHSAGAGFQMAGPNTSPWHSVIETPKRVCSPTFGADGSRGGSRAACINIGKEAGRAAVNLNEEFCRIKSINYLFSYTNICVNGIYRGCIEAMVEDMEEKAKSGSRRSGRNPIVQRGVVRGLKMGRNARKDLKETWIFAVFERPDNEGGERTMKFKTPASITDWSIQAIGVSPNRPLCMTQETAVTKKECFMTINSPPTAVVGEQFNVKIFIHNTGQRSKYLKLRLSYSNGLCGKSRMQNRSVRVSAGSTQLESFSFVATSTGKATMQFSLNGKMDKVEKSIVVEDSTNVSEREADMNIEVSSFQMKYQQLYEKYCGGDEEDSEEEIDDEPPYLPPPPNSGARSRRGADNSPVYCLTIGLSPKRHADRWTMKVGMLTGFEPDHDTLSKVREKHSNLLWYNVSEGHVIFHFHLNVTQRMNITFALMEPNGGRSIPSYINVHPHTTPHHATVKRYHVKDITHVPLVCDEGSNDRISCRCFDGICQKQSTNRNDYPRGHQLSHKVCSVDNGYAFRAKVDKINDYDPDFIYINVTIEESYYCVADRLVPGKQRQFIAKKRCGSLEGYVEENTSYTFVGTTPPDQGRHEVRPYLLDEHAAVIPTDADLVVPNTSRHGCIKRRNDACALKH